jgi:hypothetical protein
MLAGKAEIGYRITTLLVLYGTRRSRSWGVLFGFGQYGVEAIPARWANAVELRDEIHFDGR